MSSELICEDERQRRLLRMLFRKSGVEQRHTVIPWRIGYEWKAFAGGQESGRGPTTGLRMQLYAELASSLAEAAARSALQDADLDAREITHLVTVSCTGFHAPGVDIDLMRRLELRPTTQRVHVGYMGCHGAINGLRVAQGLAAANPRARVLVCAVELCSLHYRLNWDDEGVKGNALFADGAAALVGGAPQTERTARWEVQRTGSCLIPDSVEEMSWKIGDYGFEMRLTGQVPILIENHLKRWVSAWLDESSSRIEDVEQWVVHPGGPRILDAVETALNLPSGACDVSREVLRRCGNMSSPTVLFILDRLRQQQRGPTVLLGFGPGLMAESAFLS